MSNLTCQEGVTVINLALVNDLKKRDLWDEVIVNDLKYFDGSLASIDRIPQDLKMFTLQLLS